MAILPVAESKSTGGCERPGVAFDKASEVAEPGYYAVTLAGGVKCEATATERVAVWRFAWPEGAARRLYVDAAAMLMQAFNAKQGATVLESQATLGADSRTIRGGKKALGWTPYPCCRFT